MKTPPFKRVRNAAEQRDRSGPRSTTAQSTQPGQPTTL